MMASIDEDVEKSSLTDQDDVGSGVSSSRQNKSRNKGLGKSVTDSKDVLMHVGEIDG
ncbi:hypothetical protein Tco_0697760, partial [Tanacetum coccineum]